MTCDRVQEQLTAYLDGELDGDRGTVVRGHLRTCAACRDVAAREAALRDGLRDLPTVDPPSGMWAGVQARLAAAEVAEAERPAWKRFLSRLAPAQWMPSPTKLAAGCLVAAAAVAVVYWRTHREIAQDAGPTVVEVPKTNPVVKETKLVAPTNNILALGCRDAPADPKSGDASDDLQLDGSRLATSYCKAAQDALNTSADARALWKADDVALFEKSLEELRKDAEKAPDDHERQRIYRKMLRFITTSVARGEVGPIYASANGGAR